MRRVTVLLAGLAVGSGCGPSDAPAVPPDPAADGALLSADWPQLAAEARGFPALRHLSGEPLADGDFAQWIENDRLHVALSHQFPDGRRIQEQAVFQMRPGLAQESWSWSETHDGQPLRRFEVDFAAGIATAEKHEADEIDRWSEEIEVDPGRTFAGFGFTLALKDLREQLVAGRTVELEAVVFMPEPRVVTVELSHGGVDRMRMAGRVLRGDRFVIEPQIPWIAELFVDAPDTRIWLTHPPPAEFLRWEGPLLEPDDPVVRVDLLPGGESGAAEPLEGEAPP